jgi:glycosyltransferase involved in cell wall biosynthesis
VKKLILFLLVSHLFIWPCFFLCGEVLTSSPEKKLLIICDMWEDHIGGVDEVVRQVRTRLAKRSYIVAFMGLEDVSCFDVPFMPGTSSPYPWGIEKQVAKKIRHVRPDYIFIVLHGILSQKAAGYCYKNNVPFTAFYPGRGPECVQKMTGIPMWISRYFINSFLFKASKILVPSHSMHDELIAQGFSSAVAWPHGIDLKNFALPTKEQKDIATQACKLENRTRPFYLYVGRISAEKNMSAFFDVDVPGTKIVVGPEDCGYCLESLQKQYPEIVFAGPQRGRELLNYYHSADVFLFPSKMDSFGLVMLEALASGLPVVGFNTTGPADVVPKGCGVSYLAESDEEFKHCALSAWAALQLDVNQEIPLKCRAYATLFSWDMAMDAFEQNLFQIDPMVLDSIENNELRWRGCC